MMALIKANLAHRRASQWIEDLTALLKKEEVVKAPAKTKEPSEPEPAPEPAPREDPKPPSGDPTRPPPFPGTRPFKP